MNRREFLKGLLGAGAVAAMPAAVLLAVEKAVAPIADQAISYTPSDYYFSTYVKKVSGSWSRIGFKISKELGDAMCGNSAMHPAVLDCIKRVLATIHADVADFCDVQLEIKPNAPNFSVNWPQLTGRTPDGSEGYVGRVRNMITDSGSHITVEAV